MIVISKKRIQIVTSCVLLGILAFSFQIARTEEQENNTTVPTTSTPVSGKTVVIDAGHGVPDEGVSLLH